MIETLYNYYVISRTHRDLRVACEENLGEQYKSLGLPCEERMTRRFELLSSMETPRIHPLEQIVLTRSVANLPDMFYKFIKMFIKFYIHIFEFIF